MSTLQTGHIQNWNEARGFGFIRPQGKGDDVFLHISAWPAPSMPQPGERVQYQTEQTPDGKTRAVQVRRLAGPAPASATQPRRSGRTSSVAENPRPTQTTSPTRNAPISPVGNRAAAGPRAPSRTSSASARRPARERGGNRPRPALASWALGLLLTFVLLLTGLCLWGQPPVWVALVYLGMSFVTFLFYAHDKQAARQDTWRVPENQLLLLGLACGWPGGLLAQQLLRHKSVKTAFLVPFWLTVAFNVGALLWLSRNWHMLGLPA